MEKRVGPVSSLAFTHPFSCCYDAKLVFDPVVWMFITNKHASTSSVCCLKYKKVTSYFAIGGHFIIIYSINLVLNLILLYNV